MAVNDKMTPPQSLKMSHIKATLRRTGVHYEVGLSAMENLVDLPDNLGAVRSHFLSLERKLRNDPKARRATKESMEDTISSDHAVSVTELATARTWFQPLPIW